MPRAVTQSKEDYLERIHEVIEIKGYARASDIAAALDLRRPSVTAMVQRLGKLGYLSYEKYRGFTLTGEGRRVALSIKARHELLAELFTLLGLDPRRDAVDIEGLEHHLSDRSLAKFKKLVEHLRAHPMGTEAKKKKRIQVKDPSK